MTEEVATAITDTGMPASTQAGEPRTALAAMTELVQAAGHVEGLCEDLDRLSGDRESAVSQARSQAAQSQQAAEAAVAAAETASALTHRDIIARLQAARCDGANQYSGYAGEAPGHTQFVPNADGARSQREMFDIATQIQAVDSAVAGFRVLAGGVKAAIAVGAILVVGGFIASADLPFIVGLAVIAAAIIIRMVQKNRLSSSALELRTRLGNRGAAWSQSVLAEVEDAKTKAKSQIARAHKTEADAAAEAKRIFNDQTTKTREEADARSRELTDDISRLDEGLIRGPWSDAAWDAWAPHDAAPSCVRIGRLLPRMPRYYHYFPKASTVEIPALTSYRGNAGLLFESDLALREAREIAQSIILRLLATLPPAAVRFVFIDPVSLGDNVAAFMSLERYEAALIGGKAWSEGAHIDKALAEVTEHMETVIQKYLRDDFETIEEYNAQARVKEAYRVVVVFDFPIGFGDSAAKRLVTIMRNGPRCGVFPVVIADTSKPLPYGFSLAELERFALVMRQSDQRSARVGVQPRYHAYLTAVAGVDVIALTKQLQAITGVEAEQARRLGDSYALPTLIAQGVTEARAGEIQSRLESVGAQVRFEPADAASPTTSGLQTEDRHA